MACSSWTIKSLDSIVVCVVKYEVLLLIVFLVGHKFSWMFSFFLKIFLSFCRYAWVLSGFGWFLQGRIRTVCAFEYCDLR